ncbi:Hypothetical predicted protein [Mytilus galloprovincialis]|uniref:C-type lectin domain-containing protein n=1 Tax=Mytilus galloprovincialis TaxID=29158 RepID=A0A8B6D0Y2_MYTGA|nr:Hypothetical predicted protein [Mytilus galloprovincialis]
MLKLRAIFVGFVAVLVGETSACGRQNANVSHNSTHITCRQGWISKGSGKLKYCYYISAVGDVKSQSKATAACTQKNGMLFFPSDSYESREFKKYVKSNQISTPFYWTSGHKDNYQWTWGVDPFKYPFQAPNWAEGQPDGALKGECIAVQTQGAMMDDQPCGNKYNYICKSRT